MNKILFAIVLSAAGLQGAGSISGTVVDPTDAVMPNASIKLHGDGIERLATPGPEGRFVFAELAPGAYSIEVSHAGFRTTTWKAELAKDGVDLGRLTLPVGVKMYSCPDVASEPIVDWLDGTPGIDGIVQIPTRLPATAVTISVRATSGNRLGQSLTPDGNGRFSFSGLAAGTYSLRAHANEFIDFVIDSVVVKDGKRTMVNSGLPLSPCPKGMTCQPIKKVSIIVLCL